MRDLYAEPPLRLDRAIMAQERTRLLGRLSAWLERESVELLLADGSEITLRAAGAPIAPFDIVLPLDLTRTRLRDVRVRAGGAVVGTLEPARIDAAELAADAPNGAHIRARLEADGRGGMPPMRELINRFESLGDNCEFGIFARSFETVRPSLFRYGGTGEHKTTPRRGVEKLADGIADFFEGLDEDGDLSLEWRDNEWVSVSARYGSGFHTGDHDPNTDRAELLRRQRRRLGLSVRVFVEQASNPDIIFVRKSNGHENEADLRSLRAALRTHGKARLLWVDLADPAEPEGLVSLLDGGLVKARLPAMQPYDDAGRPDRFAWLRLVVECWTMIEGVARVQD